MKIFITGVSSGIGRETVKLLIKEGHEVWGIARRIPLLEELKSELGAIGSEQFFFSSCDVAKEEQVEAVIKAMEERNFVPDVVVLGSAILPKDLESEAFDYRLFKQGFDINCLGALVWVEKFLPKFVAKGAGKFVAVSSTSAYRPDPRSASLPSSKAALSMAFRGFRLRYANTGLKFVTVYFGPVATPVIPEYTTKSGEGKYFFVLSARAAAQKLKKAVFGERDNYYFPFWLTMFLRLTLFLPDAWFAKVSQYLKR